MALFSKKETLIKSMPLMAIMAAINVIFSFLITFVPFLAVALIIFIPLTSALVEIYCKDRYFPIYTVATLGLSIVASLSAIDFTIFYLVPSIITGYIFGLGCKKGLPCLWGIFIAAVLQTGISFAFVPLINVISEVNFLDKIKDILQIEEEIYFNNIVVMIFFFISLVQTVLSYIAVSNELKKFGFKNSIDQDWRLPVDLCIIVSSGLAVGLFFVYPPISLLCVGFTWYFAFFSVVYEAKKINKMSLIIMGVLFVGSFFAFAGLNQFIEKGKEFILLGIAPLCISLVSLGFYFLKKQK